MALSGDIQPQLPEEGKLSSIRLEAEIRFDERCRVIQTEEDNPSLFSLPDVIEVIDGDIESVLPLIGYPRHKINDIVKDEVITDTDEVKEKLKALGPRHPDAYIVVHENKMYGVVVDEYNICRVVGQITSVVPKEPPNDVINVVVIENDGLRTICSSKCLNLKHLVSTGSVLSIISIKGFAFIETEERKPEEETSELVLVVNRGYILYNGVPINWIRLQTGLRIGEFKLKSTWISAKDCIVSLRSCYLREDHRVVVYGNHNAVLDFEDFLKFGEQLETIGFESGQQPDEDQKPEDENNEKTEKKSDSVDITEEMSHLELEEPEEDSTEVLSTESDVTADSFS